MSLSFIPSGCKSPHGITSRFLSSAKCNRRNPIVRSLFASDFISTTDPSISSSSFSSLSSSPSALSSSSSSLLSMSRSSISLVSTPTLANMSPASSSIDTAPAASSSSYHNNGDSSGTESAMSETALEKQQKHTDSASASASANTNANANANASANTNTNTNANVNANASANATANNIAKGEASSTVVDAIDTENSNNNTINSSSSYVLNPLVEDGSSTSYEHVLDTVLKVFCTHCEPNYELPWAMTPQRTSTSSAFVIPGRKILTNAHSVEHYTSVKLKRRDRDTKYTAKVVAIGNECDIALLSVEDETFWEQFEADAQGKDPYLVPGPLPHLQDSVLVIGYPTPGNQISVTAGVSSRVEMQNYVHGHGELLTVQIDAAINPGNSGGPVINQHHQVVGIAFQSIDPSQADSIGYFIPYCVVQHFLDDIAHHDRYTGFPFAGFRWQRMENPTLRRAKKLPESESGVLVKWVAETSDGSRVLRKSDIVTHIDGVSVSNAGTVPFRSGERIGLDFLVTSKFCNDFLTVTVMREGKQLVESYQLSSMEDHRLVPVHDARHLVRRQPEYIVFGGLVFQTLSEPLMRSLFGDNWLYESPVRIVDEYYRGTRTKAGRKEIVVLTQILATELNSGYESESGNDLVMIKKVNGTEVLSLKHLGGIIDECKNGEREVAFELEGDDVIILDREAAEAEEESVLTTHCIPASRSLCPGDGGGG